MDELFRHVKDVVEREKGHWPRLATDSGVSYSWITKFGAGKVPSPNLRTLRKIAEARPERLQ